VLTLTNILVTPHTVRIRIVNVIDPAGSGTPVIEIPISRQAATKPTLTSISLTSFTYGVGEYTDLVFNETLQSFTPSIDGDGATVTTTWVLGQSTARVLVQAVASSTTLTFVVVDSNDGGSDTKLPAL
jgi:cellulase/cellobiase CelA1